MPPRSQLLFRQRSCRAPACRVLFFICSYCDRGQVYCSESCRQPVRRQQRRQANRRQQQTLRGRLAHSRRQHAYRRRLAHAHCRRNEKIVTGHSSQARLRVRPSRRVSSPDWVTTICLVLMSTFGGERPDEQFVQQVAAQGWVTCQFCGRCGRFLNSS